MYRQGDVLLVPVKLPVRSKGRLSVAPVNGRIMLAYGEVTGHHHSIVARPGVLLLDEGGVTYLTIAELTGSVELEHQEHATVLIPPGSYRVVAPHEWTDADEPRRSAD